MGPLDFSGCVILDIPGFLVLRFLIFGFWIFDFGVWGFGFCAPTVWRVGCPWFYLQNYWWKFLEQRGQAPWFYLWGGVKAVWSSLFSLHYFERGLPILYQCLTCAWYCWLCCWLFLKVFGLTMFSWLNPWAEFPGTHWFFKLVFRSVYVNSQGDKIYSMLWINIYIWRKIMQLADLELFFFFLDVWSFLFFFRDPLCGRTSLHVGRIFWRKLMPMAMAPSILRRQQPGKNLHPTTCNYRKFLCTV